VNGESAVIGFKEYMFATKLQRAIADEGAGKEACLAQHLKAVADAKHRPTLATKACTACITGLNRAMAPVRR